MTYLEELKSFKAKETKISKIHNDVFNLNVKLVKIKHQEHELAKHYNIKRYFEPNKFSWSSELEELIPHDTPLFICTKQKYVDKIARALAYFKQCALVGPSGTGKTHVVYLVAELAHLPLWEINCSLQTSVFDMFGRYIGLGKENWIDGVITSWCRYGGILYLDEANMMKQDIATKLNPLLDQRGHMVLSEKDNEIITRHKDAFLIISMNPVSVEFAGTKPLNAALRRRMNVWLNFDYLSIGDKIAQEEIDLILSKTDLSNNVVKNIVRTSAELRKVYENGDLPYAPSVSDLISWAKIIADGVTPKEAAEETIVSMTSDDPEIQDEVRRTVSRFLDN